MTSIFDEFFVVLAFIAVLLVSPWLFPAILGFALRASHKVWTSSQPQLKRLNAWWEQVKASGGSQARAPSTVEPITRRHRPAPQTLRTYHVQLGDMTLRLVAYEALGDWRRWRELLALNEDVISDPNLLIPGTALTIPAQ